eukprot:4250608-Pyramimonas_sp.AAC.1
MRQIHFPDMLAHTRGASAASISSGVSKRIAKNLLRGVAHNGSVSLFARRRHRHTLARYHV